MRVTRLAAIAATAAIFAGCTDIYGNDDGNGNGDFTVSVSTGTQPNYSWNGGPAFRVDVVPVANPLVPVWAIASPNPNTLTISSPLRHGNVPTGMILLVNDEPTLRAGVNYRVTITLPDNSRASTNFRP
jgi:hypothetical protein